MNTKKGIYALRRIGLALVAGAMLLETSCTLDDVVSAIGLTSLLNTVVGLAT